MTEVAPVRRKAGRPTREQAEARHEELLDTAMELFLEHGYELATIEMIATRVNMTKRTVYARYPDKASLFLAAVRRGIDRQVVPWEVLASFDNGDPAETLEAVARLRIGQMMTPNGLRLQRVINAESYRFPEIFVSNYTLSAGPVVDFVAGVLERAAAAGKLVPTNYQQAARAFTSMTIGGQTRAIVAGRPPTQEQIDERVSFTVRLLLEGLLPR
ncbi:MAG TPA: TetR/AcrR family transcriptional regulator [Yinghuangia sp.]|nr:TetR/AcrR family transcriptional regulator [Yinghuangia sp.]